MTYITKDSGERQEYASGMRRDLQTGKTRYDLLPLEFIGGVMSDTEINDEDFLNIVDSFSELQQALLTDKYEAMGAAFGLAEDIINYKSQLYPFDAVTLVKELAELMTRGAEKYGESNWKLAESDEELARFYQSAFRHFMQFANKEKDEDHFSATLFNIAAIHHVLFKRSL
jgi:hypothetical protein